MDFGSSSSLKKPTTSKKKKKTKGPRLALHLPREVQGLHLRGQAIRDAIKDDSTHFKSPYPPLSEVDADLEALGIALKEAEGGGPIALTALGVAEDKVRQTLELLGKYVQSVVRAGPIEDAPAIISKVLMYESNVGKRPPKPEIEARQGNGSGLARVIALAVPTAVAYFWEHRLDEEAWTPSAQTAQAQCSVADLTPGKTYSFRFRALRRDGTMTEFSQVVNFMVK